MIIITLEGDEQIGVDIMRKALATSAMIQIANNAGEEGVIVAQKVKEGKDDSFGYNAATKYL